VNSAHQPNAVADQDSSSAWAGLVAALGIDAILAVLPWKYFSFDCGNQPPHGMGGERVPDVLALGCAFFLALFPVSQLVFLLPIWAKLTGREKFKRGMIFGAVAASFVWLWQFASGFSLDCKTPKLFGIF
jgi:hypothetical protein